jgi:phosphoribosyl-ATP pyrophosphohydrolase/phosphoribosyl-AMP cyclohydrolase
MIIPSIDLMDGKAVQLRQGSEKVLERDDPEALAARFGRFGEIAVIDLDAAMDRGSNEPLIGRLCRAAECRVGGGIRSIDDARRMIAAGAARVIVGTKAFEGDRVNHEFLSGFASAVGREQIILAIDAREGKVVTQAWKHNTGLDLMKVVEEVEPYASQLLFTVVEKEGMMQGTDMDLIRRLAISTEVGLTAAGGVSTMKEIEALAQIGADVQLGMALYTGKINLEEGFLRCLNWREPLLPTVACDPSGQVLMLAYSSKESLAMTFATGKMWYYSRSRDKLWKKGETSGNVQSFIRIRVDCDRDALLATVIQEGAACHTGLYSCFGGRRFSLQELYDIVRDRFEHPVPGSYTATLDDAKVREKLIEEAGEVIEARGRDEIIWEAADLLYFLTALAARSGVTLEDILAELRRRRKK